ncbi:Glycine/D-amino acid oxidase [Rhizobiales bacterium GAS191]|nr:Glycine/D-amino acid oxidase [Rhizobiales bacterium GAS113]SEC42519.1 Glycine/D-amino acid oxidase [Rhizobiales bacterium GAS191]
MMPSLDTIATDAVLPQRAAVVVIGGGIIGVSAALHLARKGVDVVLCEKGRIGCEQSGRNWGWVRAMGRDLAEIPLSLESQRLWGEMNTLCEAETGYRRCGILYLCDTEKEMAAQRAWLDEANRYQITSQVVSPSELAGILPSATRQFAGALITPTDGRAEPQKASAAIAAAARRFGARILEGCAVRGLDLAAGRVAGVVTEKGRIACETVILAGGAWSRLFCGNEGIDLPQLKMLSSVFATQPMEGGPEVTVGGPDFAFRKRLDGGYTVARRNASIAHITPDSFRLFFDFLPSLIKGWDELRLRPFGRFLEEWRMPRRWQLDAASPFEAVRVLDPAPDQPQLDEARNKIATTFPFFRDMAIKEAWGGLIDVTPDAVPVISKVAQLPGLVIATGFSGHGFGIGPGSGKLAAELATEATPTVDPNPFRLGRFKRGERSARA